MTRRWTAPLVLAALAVVACGNSDTDADVTGPGDTAEEGAAATTVASDASTPSTDTAGSTTPATTSTTTTTSTRPAASVSSTEPGATAAVTPSEPASTTTSAPAASTATTDLARRLGDTLVAIDGDGDALAFFDGPDAAPVVLFDGPDPDAPPPAEGPGPNVVDGIALAPSADTAYVGTCCEPIAGAILVTEPPEPATYGPEPPLIGYGPAISPDGRHLASGQIALGVVSILDRSTGARLEVPPLGAAAGAYSPYDTMWLDDRRLATLGIWSSGAGSTWVMYPVEVSDGVVTVGDRVDLSGAVGDATDVLVRFAGRLDDDRIALHRRGDDAVLAVPFAAGPRAGRAEPAVVDGLEQAALTVWTEPGQPTIVVTEDRRLQVGGVRVEGEYLWART